MPGSGESAPGPGDGGESEVSVTPRSSEEEEKATEKPDWKAIDALCVKLTNSIETHLNHYLRLYSKPSTNRLKSAR